MLRRISQINKNLNAIGFGFRNSNGPGNCSNEIPRLMGQLKDQAGFLDRSLTLPFVPLWAGGAREADGGLEKKKLTAFFRTCQASDRFLKCTWSARIRIGPAHVPIQSVKALYHGFHSELLIGIFFYVRFERPAYRQVVWPLHIRRTQTNTREHDRVEGVFGRYSTVSADDPWVVGFSGTPPPPPPITRRWTTNGGLLLNACCRFSA